MQRYLFRGSYTAEGIKGVIKDGGTGRKAAVEKLAKSVGGKLISMHFTLGEGDFVVMADLPDEASAIAIATTTSATGTVSLTTTRLITPEEMDEGVKKSVTYRAPGK
jgi:uncharacterized protein with GYD domain